RRHHLPGRRDEKGTSVIELRGVVKRHSDEVCIGPTHDHRFILPVAALAGYAVLTSAYFVLRHVFYAGGAVTVVIELIGGITFLVVVMRKGRL
ncbi:hypothetical protein D9C01_13165, partial [Corynebacterium diphtheriae]